jgi:hypothetical protein
MPEGMLERLGEAMQSRYLVAIPYKPQNRQSFIPVGYYEQTFVAKYHN